VKTINDLVDAHFVTMCEKGDFEQVKYWLTSPDVEVHANIHADFEGGLISACVMGNLEIVKYLLTSPDLKDHANIHAERDMAFRFAYATYSFPNSPTKEVIDYLIKDYGLPLTNNIKKDMKQYPNEEVSKLFGKRNLMVVDGKNESNNIVRDIQFGKLKVVK
jgi:hypothetical protein